MKINKNTVIFDIIEKRIENEFIKLLQTTGYNKITISQLVTESEINRSTFYAHFLDKEDLITHLQVNLLTGLTKDLPDVNIHNLNDSSVVKNRIETIIRRIYANKQLFELFYSDKSDGLFFSRFSDFSEKLLLQTDIPESMAIPEVYSFAVINGAMVSLIQGWIKRDFTETPEEFSSIISQILPAMFKNIIA
ncbi:TetR/AcrR family transcriptional regulator [Leuconostoc mesenteroides]